MAWTKRLLLLDVDGVRTSREDTKIVDHVDKVTSVRIELLRLILHFSLLSHVLI